MLSIMGPICHLFDMSFKTGYIPTILKTDKIVPVFRTCESDDLQITDQLVYIFFKTFRNSS